MAFTVTWSFVTGIVLFLLLLLHVLSVMTY